ncbi:MAG: HlyD family efflux transporter periplasmic adaptor subunit [Saprospiraceae bacterium]
MLNISDNTVKDDIRLEDFSSYNKISLSRANVFFKRWLIITFIILLIILFFPWTQNIQSKGIVTSLNPEHRPQTIHSTIAGRIEKWYVQEGQLIKKGDTIVHLSEIKTEYFDPMLVERTGQQADAADQTIGFYQQKANALEQQIGALRNELQLKKQQLANKIEQQQLKINSDSIDLERAIIDLQIAERQLNRTKALEEKGLKSLTEVEDKNLKFQEAFAKRTSLQNKLAASRNEYLNTQIALTNVENEYLNKISKASSDRFSTFSEKYKEEAKAAKLRSELANYQTRSGFYFITAPQDCYVTKAMVTGIGETIKEGQPVVSIMPKEFTLAVEMEVQPIDLPLIHKGNSVNFIFDGWPAFVFSGWPNLTFGTYSGEVVAIDNEISQNNTYRVLVRKGPNDKDWPDALRVGSGAKCIALLEDVPVWYELWRKLNGFPPEFYNGTKMEKEESKQIENKAPIKSAK